MGRRMVRKAARREDRQNTRPPWKQTQQKRRDTPPLIDGVASVAILRFTPEGKLMVLGVEDRDKRKARERGGMSRFQVVLPGGRRKHNEGDGREEPVHVTAQKEGMEEMGVKISLAELLPLMVAHRVGTGKNGRDSFDREMEEGEEVQYPHFLFACIGDKVEPIATRDKDASNPKWYSFWEEILIPPAETSWSFDHVTLLTYALKTLGELYGEWVWDGWKQESLPDEIVGNAFFTELTRLLQESPEIDRALQELSDINFFASIAQRIGAATAEGRKMNARWYLGERRDEVPDGKKKGLFMPDSFHPLGDTRTYFDVLAALKMEQNSR